MIKKIFFALFLLVATSNIVTAQTTDPWIIEIYYDEWFRKPDDLEKNIKNYNGGSWNSKQELRKYIMDFQKSKASMNIWYEIIPLKDKTKSIVIAHDNKGPGAAALISNADGRIISSDGASIISGGAGNLIGQDGAGLRSKVEGLGGLQYGSSNTLMSESLKPIKSGKGSLIIMMKRKK